MSNTTVVVSLIPRLVIKKAIPNMCYDFPCGFRVMWCAKPGSCLQLPMYCLVSWGSRRSYGLSTSVAQRLWPGPWQRKRLTQGFPVRILFYRSQGGKSDVFTTNNHDTLGCLSDVMRVKCFLWSADFGMLKMSFCKTRAWQCIIKKSTKCWFTWFASG